THSSGPSTRALPRKGLRAESLPHSSLMGSKADTSRAHRHREATMRRSTIALAVTCFALGAAFAFALEPGRGRAQAQQDVVRAFLSSVQHPAPGEFSTPQSAIRYLVEQVRTQNVSAAT